MAYSYKGAISFGLIYIPVTMHASVKSNQISFNLLEKQTMSRVKYKKTCVDCNNGEIQQQDIIKGYEYEQGKYVVFTDDDFEKIKSSRDKNITITAFVGEGDIDPLYYNKPYYLIPGKGADRAYLLLADAMEKKKKVGIAKAVLGTKETLIAIRAKGRILNLNTMYFYEEIQNIPYSFPEIKPNKQELSLAAALIESMSGSFKPKDYEDEYRKKIEKAIQAKIRGKEFAVRDDEVTNPALDLMSALEESLRQYGTEGRA